MEDSISDIQSFYKGKTIFVTGASGFMGKVLIEKLLYSCSDLDKIYILMRSKRGRTFINRLEEMFKLPMFVRVQNEKPEMFKKVLPMCGDISSENLGLSEKQENCLINEVNIVFHCAASLRLEAKLKDAIEMNTIGTKRVLNLAKQMKQLKAFIYLSTAFCHVDQMELGERIYEAPHDPQDIMKLIEWMDESTIDDVTSKILTPHPNSYTYTKRLAETLVANEYPAMPCAIARPSIVTPSYKEPIPGWVDNLNGPIGLLVGGGKGVIRSMHCNADYHAQVIPVDFAINALITFAYTIGTTEEKSKSIPVVNITQSKIEPMTWGEILTKGKKIVHEYPFEGQVWYPDGDIRKSKFIHNLFVFFFQIIPAYLIDFLMVLFRQKRFMVRIQNRILVGLDVLQYFTTREWMFHNNRLVKMFEEQSPKDQELFPFITHNADIPQYLKDIVLGARQYCMKEDLSTLPKARRHQRIMYIVHLIAIYLFYFGILYFVYKHLEFARDCLDYSTDKMKSLPIIGRMVAKAHL